MPLTTEMLDIITDADLPVAILDERASARQLLDHHGSLWALALHARHLLDFVRPVNGDVENYRQAKRLLAALETLLPGATPVEMRRGGWRLNR